MANEPKYDLLAEIRPEIAATLEGGLQVTGIPEYMHDGLVMYLRYGVRPGSFLEHVLGNDLMGACAYGDENNQRALCAYVRFLNNMPAVCYGSPAKVDAWIKLGADRRKRKASDASTTAS